LHPNGANSTVAEMSKVCPSCKTQHPSNYRRCAFCRTALEPLDPTGNDRVPLNPSKQGGKPLNLTPRKRKSVGNQQLGTGSRKGNQTQIPSEIAQDGNGPASPGWMTTY